MKTDSNTILITGGGSGIGRGLAEAFHRSGSRVIISGRREALLKKICAANPGMNYLALDVTDPASIKAAVREVTARFPSVNCLINNAGIQREHDFSGSTAADERVIAEEIAANLTGVVMMCGAFVPLLRRNRDAVIVNVSSGLAFVPLAAVPVYSATKAAVHSFSLSLRRQLRDAAVKVIELIPPYVNTGLDQGLRKRDRPANGPGLMPLEAFVDLAMSALAGEEEEIAIGPAQFLRSAAGDDFKQVFARMNP